MQIENRVQEQSETDSLANFRSLAESFRRTLLAENKSPRTVATYTESLRAFGFQMGLLVLVLAVSISNFYEREYFFAHAEESVVGHARAVAAEREKALRTAELAQITVRIADPRSSELYKEAARRGFADHKTERALV